MTIVEAEHILGIVSAALLQETDFYHPVSALQGYDVFQIEMALKLRIANVFLFLARAEDFEREFDKMVRTFAWLPLEIVNCFVPDSELARLAALPKGSAEYKHEFVSIFPKRLDPSTKTIRDKRLASLETPESFGDYCKTVGPEDPIYWQKIYTRIGLEYTSTSPRGNRAVPF